VQWILVAGAGGGLEVVHAQRSSQDSASVVVDAFVMTWYAAGRGRIDMGGRSHEVAPFEIALAPPRLAVTAHPLSGAAPSMSILVPPAAFALAVTAASDRLVASFDPAGALLRGRQLERAAVGFYRAITESCPALLQDAAWLDLVRALVACSGQQAPAAPAEPQAIRRAREYLHDHPRGPVQLDDLARAAQLSKYHFVRRFRRAIGLSPHQYHLCVRAEHARGLLRRGAPPSDAALATGFFDQSHFTRVFQRVFGITPGRYARAWR